VSSPERDLDRQQRRLEDKFSALAAPVLGDARAERLLAVLATPSAGRRVGELMALARV
jgi:hypothetical protein